MSTSSVRVGIRIRPLVSKEKGQAQIIDSHDNESIVFKGQTFTFDHVFGSDMSQIELYEKTAATMLKNVLEGYNCTIIAYGQTGSGKTFTMGTSDVSNHDIGSLGLIPRFVNDLFQNLNDPEDQDITYKVKASFLEIYGEDVYDLLGGQSSNNMMSRTGLLVREDETGRVFVQNQIELDVSDPESALEALSSGSSNRITAATAMNAGSSRSHAVFTLSITQYVKSGEDDMVQNMSSKLTFVDLAGSERIKRTGAEGQRMKEGIQINSGLFNLGQVINSLADEQKIKAGQKPAFVPYRNSKLTHLLKDALGGNSQTLFLACVSPAESNESETYSTLSYARQARNIQNKPIKNMDETQTEIRRLKLGMRTWMLKAVKLAFCPTNNNVSVNGEANFGVPASASKLMNGMFSPGAATLLSQLRAQGDAFTSVGPDEEALLQRPEVIEFIEAINASIKEKATGFSPSPRKVRLSLGVNPVLRNNHHGNHHGGNMMMSPSFTSPRRNHRLSVMRRLDTPSSWMPPATNDKDDGAFAGGRVGGRESILFSLDLNSALEAAGHNVSDSQVLIERMMDVIHEEKRILNQQKDHKHTANNNDGGSVMTENTSQTNNTSNSNNINNNDDSGAEDNNEDNDEEEEMQVVDKLIAEKEEILNKLMENIKGYSVLKTEFEKLVDAINGLELEKKELETELEKAKKTNQTSPQMDKIKERFVTVKEELRKMKEDRKTKEQAYKMMQKESKALETMQRELQKLKESKVSMMKQQKTQFNEIQKMKKEQVVKLQLLKKSDVKKQQQMNALKSELTKKERIIGHRDKEIGRMAMKLKACEDHITQLLKIQNRTRQKTTNNTTGANVNNNSNSIINSSTNNSSARNLRQIAGLHLPHNSSLASAIAAVGLSDVAEAEHLVSSKGVMDQAVLSQVDRKVCRLVYEKKTAMLRQLNQMLLSETADLEAIHKAKQSLLDEHSTNHNSSANTAANTSEENAVVMQTLLIESLSPEKKVLYETFEQCVKLAEAKIERLTKDIDLFNADIDDLSLQLEKLDKQSSNSSTDANTNNANNSIWDTIGTEVILALSASQAQALLLATVQDKVLLSTNLRTSEAEVALLVSKVEAESSTSRLLASHVEDMRTVHRDRLVQLEKQRLEDVWAMMKAASSTASSTTNGEKSDNTGSNTNNTSTNTNASAAVDELQRGVLFQKARMLETALEEETLQKQSLSEQLSVCHTSLAKLTRENSELDMQLQMCLRVNDNSSSDENEASNNAAGSLDGEYLKRLQSLWQETGLPLSERHLVMDCLLRSQEMAKERAMFDAERALLAATEDYQSKKDSVQKLVAVLGRELTTNASNTNSGDMSVPTVPDWDRLQTLPKQEAVEELISWQVKLVKLVKTQYLPQSQVLRDTLDHYISEMWLANSDLPLCLQRLSVLPPTDSSNSNNHSMVDSDNNDDDYFCDTVVGNLATHQVCFDEFSQWKEALTSLNLTRVKNTASLIALRDQCVALCRELGFTNTNVTTGVKEGLQELMQQVFAEDSEVTQKALSATLQILTQQTLSNPPGAQSLLVAFEKAKLLLESVRLNRSTVTQLLKRLLTNLSDDLNLTTAVTNNTNDIAGCDRQTVDQQAHTVLSLPSTLQNAKFQLIEEIISLSGVVTGGADRPSVTQLLQLTAARLSHNNVHNSSIMSSVLEIAEELSGMEVFVEEAWLQTIISQLLPLLQPADDAHHTTTSSRNNGNGSNAHSPYSSIIGGCNSNSSDSNSVLKGVSEVSLLQQEKRRLESLNELLSELQRTDTLLVKHLVELEEFEEKSKADRAKALAGNSKMLIEEEKFRKNGKKKYETITEKMLSLYAKLVNLTTTATTTTTTTATNNSNNNIVVGYQPLVEVKVSIQSLSVTGQTLLRGGVSKEKIELMRLHTASASAAATSITTAANNINNNSNSSNNTGGSSNNISFTSPTQNTHNSISTAAVAASAAATASAPANTNNSTNTTTSNTTSTSVSGRSALSRANSSKENSSLSANNSSSSRLPVVVGGKGSLSSRSNHHHHNQHSHHNNHHHHGSHTTSNTTSSLAGGKRGGGGGVAPKTSGHVSVTSSSLASLALENPLTFASEIGHTHSNKLQQQLQSTHFSSASSSSANHSSSGPSKAAGRRYSFQPPTPPQQQDNTATAAAASNNSSDGEEGENNSSEEEEVQVLETILPVLADL